MDAHDAVVRDLEGKEIGTVLTCATDMAIGRHEGRIYSVAIAEQAGRPRHQGPELRVHQGGARTCRPARSSSSRTASASIQVIIETDVRPDRTARKALKNFL